MKTAVVLFNMGGPSGPDAVRPFLFNLFNDPAIIGAPRPVRWLLAQWISRRRARVARGIYEKIGGSSPLLELTVKQAAALEQALGDDEGVFKSFICMRYWRPMSGEAARAVRDFAPDRIVLLPLYPQFSTTTTASSLADWRRAATTAGITAPTAAICCYPAEPGLARAQAEIIRASPLLAEPGVRVLFSAHGLPQKIVDAGDPYPGQVARTVAAIMTELAVPGLDHAICYQSRVGPLQWIGPSLDDELKHAAADGVAVIVVPVAFVSEHSETLVELDMEYREMARELGVPAYGRAPAVGDNSHFIDALKRLVEAAAASLNGADNETGPVAAYGIWSGSGRRDCPPDCGCCPNI